MKYIAIIGSFLLFFLSTHCALAAFSHNQFAIFYATGSILSFISGIVCVLTGIILFFRKDDDIPEYDNGQLDIDAGHKRFITGGK